MHVPVLPYDEQHYLTSESFHITDNTNVRKEL